MRRTLTIVLLLSAALAIVAFVITSPQRPYDSLQQVTEVDLKRGEYLFYAAGCVSCHRSSDDALLLGGGVKLETPFGALVSPNISPSKEYGIGSWSDSDFLNAVKAGVSPNGQHYFPGFPYARYTGLSDAEVLDIKAFIFSLPAVEVIAAKHEIGFPFNIRRGIGFWKIANFDTSTYTPNPNKSDMYNRGKYLVEHAAHCQECHTPRNITLGLDSDKAFEGSLGFDGVQVPGLNTELLKALGEQAFVEGVLVHGNDLNNQPLTKPKMLEVVASTRKLSLEDRRAIYTYIAERDD